MYSEDNGRPNFPVKIIVSLEILKPLFDISDKELLESFHSDICFMKAVGLKRAGQLTLGLRILLECYLTLKKIEFIKYSSDSIKSALKTETEIIPISLYLKKDAGHVQIYTFRIISFQILPYKVKDVIFAASILIEMLSVTNKKLSELMAEINHKFGYYTAAENDIRFTVKEKAALIQKLFVDKKLPDFEYEVQIFFIWTFCFFVGK